ncbi:TMEM175 family protein [Bifidobacterium pseudolongum]|uniref:TMEM175 family protein n=1 Tax=Bifidobacterium pseudolongum TaxID=1694 RepID=UPI00214C8DC2|nr:TMEM175 family protein [Bifidobacterium pseudolongum]
MAFTDAVLAIIMTILVLDLDKPDPLTWSGFGKLWPQFLAYAFSFFWLGSMWVHLHIEWSGVKLVDQPVLWTSITLLFFCSLIPYSTSLVAGNVLSWDLAIKIVGIMITLTIWPPAMLVFTLAAAMFLFLKSASAERRMQVKIKKDALANNGMATPDDVAAVGGSAEEYLTAIEAVKQAAKEADEGDKQ